MLGLFVAVLVFAFGAFISGDTYEASFLSASGFLYWWYIVTGAIIGVILALVVLGVTAGGAAVGHRGLGKQMNGSAAGAVVGAGVGGSISALIVVLAAIPIVMSIGGAWLLSTAGAPGMAFEEFDQTKLIFGSILIVLSALFGMSRRSKSSD